MADVVINKRQLAQVQARLNKIGKGATIVLKEAVNDASELVSAHAKSKHFFVGVGKGSSAKARMGEFKFKNPDGSLRFKIRTNNLIRSIQVKAARVIKGVVEGSVRPGIEYAKQIEEGGVGRAAFPFMKPAAESVRPKFFKVVRNQLAKYLRSQRAKGG